MENANKEETGKTATEKGIYRPKLTFYHPNPRGTGGAVSFELHPAHDDVDGSLMAKVANQLTVGDRQSPHPTYPRFDWENAICVKLDFNDLCQILQVFRGECESLGEGYGLVHATARAKTIIKLRHLVDPVAGYSFEVYRTARAGGEESRAHVFFNPAEATGLCESIAGSMSVVSFGIPVVLAHDTSKYEAEQKAFRHAAA